MNVNDDDKLRQMIAEEKEKLTMNLGEFAKFLAYTHDHGPDDVETEPTRSGIKKLKGTPVWVLLFPLRKCYHAFKFLRQSGFSSAMRKMMDAVKNNKWTRKREALRYLESILPDETEKNRQKTETFHKDIKISVLVPLYNTPEKFLRDMIESVLSQTYQNWELCLADASDGQHGSVQDIVMKYAKTDERIIYERLKLNAGIADNTNECIKIASGNYLALFDHDDMLHPCALYECAKVIEEKDAEFVYTDEATFDGDELNNITTYHFKPDFSIDNLRGVNYICHLSVFKKSLTDQVGMFKKEYDGSQDHDMIMRLTDAASLVCHIPKILYFWRCHSMSTSMNLDSKSYAVAAGRHAVRDAEERRGYPAQVHSAQICKTHYRLKYEISNPKVMILMDGSLDTGKKLALTAASIEKYTTYSNYEIHCVSSSIKILNEIAAFTGEYIIFVHPGMEIITSTWIEELLMFAQREDVGVVGMQILDEKDLILSSDIVIGNTAEHLAVEVNRGNRYDSPGYMGRNYYAHDVSAVSGGAVMIAKANLSKLPDAGKDMVSFMGRTLEYCIQIRELGKQVVLNPYAICRIPVADWEGGLSYDDRMKLMERYAGIMRQMDPFYNPNLSYEKYWQKR